MKNFLRKYWPFSCLFALMGIAGLYAISREAPEVVIDATSTSVLKEGIRLEGVSLLKDASSGDVKWSIKADQVLLQDENRVVVFKGFHLKVEQENGRPLTLTGHEGRYLRTKKELLIEGDLVGQSADGYTVKTQSALFNEKEGWIKGEDRVEVMGPFFHITGLGFFADIKSRLVKIGPEVTAVIKGIRDEGLVR